MACLAALPRNANPQQPYLRCRDGRGGGCGDPEFSGRSRTPIGRVAAPVGMTASAHIDMTAAHRQLVLAVLRAHLPAGTAAWVFGSRATGRARRYSDLDIAIDTGRRLSL